MTRLAGYANNTYIYTIELFLFRVLSTIGEGDALTAENKAVGEQAQEDGLWEVHDGFAVD